MDHLARPQFSQTWKRAENSVAQKEHRRIVLFAMHSLRLLSIFVLAAALGLARSAFADEPVLPGIGAAMQEMVAKNEVAGAVTVVVA